MTQERQEDLVSVPEDEMVEPAAPRTRRKGLSPALKLAGILGGGAALLTVAVVMMQGEQVGETQLRRPPLLDGTPGGQVLAESPEMQQMLREMNERRAELAAERGITSMPTPEVILQPTPQRVAEAENIPEIEVRTAEPAPQLARVERRALPAPAQTARPVVQDPPREDPEPSTQVVEAPAQEAENPFIDGMVNFMGNIARRQEPLTMASADVATPEWLERQREALASSSAQPSPQASGNPSGQGETETVFRPGDIIYGEMVNSVNSDMNAPVLVEVTSGPHRGARLVGAFTADQRAGRMVVNFTSMSFPDGRSVSVNAFAVDGRSAETAVASDVERRLVARYGPVLAATFLSSAAQSLSQPRRRIIGTGSDVDIEVEPATGRQAAFAGVAAATNVISRDLAQSAPQGPLIHLRSGFPVAILFVEGVEAPVRG